MQYFAAVLILCCFGAAFGVGCTINHGRFSFTYPEGEVVDSNATCERCRCTSGEIDCEPIICPTPYCRFGLIQEEDQCCPKCRESGEDLPQWIKELIGYGERCPNRCWVYDLTPEVWFTCVHPCPLVVCREGDVYVEVEGECCRQCRPE